MSKLFEKTLNAYKWNMSDQAVSQGINLLMNIFLLRLLTPEEFGYFVVPMIVISFIRIIQDLGYTSLIVREQNIDQVTLSTIFWVIVILGIAFSVLAYLSADLIYYWTDMPQSLEITRYLLWSVLISAFFLTSEAILRKNLQFKKIFIVNTIGILLSGIVSIMAAYSGWSFHSLTLKYLLVVLIHVFGYCYFAGWLPDLSFKIKKLRPYLSFHIPISGEQSLGFIHKNLYGILMSKYMGASSLGLYDRAYRILTVPIQQVSGSFAKLVLPAFSKIQDEKQKIAEYYLLICRLISLIVLPIMIGIMAVSENFVLFIFGPQWMDLSPLVGSFCILAIFQSISILSPSIFQTIGKTPIMFKISLVSKIINIILLVVGIFYYKTILAVAVCYTIGSVIATFMELYFILLIVKISWLKFIKNITPQLLPAILTGLVIFVLDSNIFVTLHAGFSLVVSALLGLLMYVFSLHKFSNKALKEAKMLVLQSLNKQKY
jgi:O-antigen/teichoic acid export membrane protein